MQSAALLAPVHLNVGQIQMAGLGYICLIHIYDQRHSPNLKKTTGKVKNVQPNS